jgi:hypothetical protein
VHLNRSTQRRIVSFKLSPDASLLYAMDSTPDKFALPTSPNMQFRVRLARQIKTKEIPRAAVEELFADVEK